jgi:hypothetical protein
MPSSISLLRGRKSDGDQKLGGNEQKIETVVLPFGAKQVSSNGQENFQFGIPGVEE